MKINDLIIVVRKKIKKNITVESLQIEDKTFLHKSHSSHQKDKFHLKINIKSKDLSLLSKIDANKKIFSILNEGIKNYIHSIQILIY
jgi:BolA protein